MAYGYGRRNRATGTHHATTTTTTARPTFLSRFRRRRPVYATEGTTTTTRRDRRAGVEEGHHVGGIHLGTHGGTTAPIHHHKRHVTIGDKISGAMMKLRGSLMNRPGVKAAGTRRMHGTDGRGSRHIV